MDTPMLEGLLERVEQLERANRRWRRGGAAVALLAGAVALAGAARHADEPKTVTAERFVVADREGRTVAELGVGESAVSRLDLMDGTGDRRVTLSVQKDGRPVLGLLDRKGTRRVVLVLDQDA